MELQNTSNLVLKIKRKKRSFFVNGLLEWGKNNYKNFAWRELDSTPYIKIISVVFLQKTTSRQVSEFLPAFLDYFPSAEELAAANITTIEKMLYPLGFYKRRALALKTLAILIEDENPSSPAEWESLLSRVPGLGNYSRNAFIVNSFNARRPVVDTNIKRLVSRYFGFDFVKDPRRDKRMHIIVEYLFPLKKPRDFFFSMLDFSSEVCSAKKPTCSSCVLNVFCCYFNSYR